MFCKIFEEIIQRVGHQITALVPTDTPPFSPSKMYEKSFNATGVQNRVFRRSNPSCKSIKWMACPYKPSAHEDKSFVHIGLICLTRMWCLFLCLVHTCKQNPRLFVDKSPILSVDCCRTNPTWCGIFCHPSTPATCLIAELCLKTQVRDFVCKCVLGLRIWNCSQGINTNYVSKVCLIEW